MLLIYFKDVICFYLNVLTHQYSNYSSGRLDVLLTVYKTARDWYYGFGLWYEGWVRVRVRVMAADLYLAIFNDCL